MAGDDLTICRGLTEMEARPTEFAAPVDSGLLLVTWKRSKTFVQAPRSKAIEEELKRFKATWRFVDIEADGQKIPEKAFEKDTLVLKGDQFSSYVAGKVVHGVFKIDPLAKPKTIDIIFTEGPGKGHSQKGSTSSTATLRRFASPCQTNLARPNLSARPAAATSWRS